MWWSSSALVTTAIVGRELEQAAVGLVGLDHEPLPRPPAGVGAGAADLAADQVARVRPGAAQRVHEHARRRRLAVGAGDRDRRLQARELAEQVGAVQLGRRRALGVVGRDRARVDDLGARRARWRRRGRSRGSIPAARSVAAYGEPAARSEPVTLAPSACATTASPLIPAPPIPTKCSLRPDQGWSIPVTLGRLADESRIDRVAREAFGYAELRPGQREAIEAALAGRDALVVMSTGSGKSAIYQIAGLLTPGATVVVSPLIALQRDQVDALREVAAGGAAQLNSTIRARRARARAARAGRGHARVPVPRARAARAAGGARRARGRRHLAVRGRRGALRVRVGARLPARVPAAGRGDRGARPPARAGADRDGGAAGARRDRRAARAALDPTILIRGFDRPEPALLGRALPRRAGRRAQAARAGGADRGVAAAGDRLRLDAARGRGAGRRAVRGRARRAYHAGMKAHERDDVQERFMDGDAGRRRGHHRVRHGHRQARRALGLPRRGRRVARRLLPGGRAAPGATASRPRSSSSTAPRTSGCGASSPAGTSRSTRSRRCSTPSAAPGDPVAGRRAAARDRALADQAGERRWRGWRTRARCTCAPTARSCGVDDAAAADAVRAAAEAEEMRRSFDRSRVDMMRAYAETDDCRRAFLLSLLRRAVRAAVRALRQLRGGPRARAAVRRPVPGRRARRARAVGRGRRPALRRRRDGRAVRRGRLQDARARGRARARAASLAV